MLNDILNTTFALTFAASWVCVLAGAWSLVPVFAGTAITTLAVGAVVTVVRDVCR